MSSKQICLGSAQFGLNYGVTNSKGKLNFEEVKEIINFADDIGINIIDTAQDYGDAEKIIGKCISKKRSLKIISKLRSHENTFFIRDDLSKLQKNLEETLNNLKVDFLECLLLHNENDLFKEGSSYLLEWIEKVKKLGLIKNFGISVYNFKNISEIQKLNLDIIQLPLSIYNRENFESGFINKLDQIGLKIQARSIYLQGIVLSKPTELPNWVNENDYEEHIKFQNKLKKYNISPLEACINYVKSINEIDSIVVGVTSKDELKELKDIWDQDFDFELFSTLSLPKMSKFLLDPRNWPY